MTDQTVPNVTDDDRKLAREWAEHVESSRATWGDRFRAAARVILHDLPTPTPPTLAEMSPEERAASEWMQADVAGLDGDWLIIDPFDDEVRVHVIGRKGNSRILPADFVTPRPDLPRMEWSGTVKAEDANTVKLGDVIESATDPRLDALPVGTVLLDRDNDATTKQDESWSGAGYEPIPDEGDEFGPWKVAHIGEEANQ